MPDDGHEFYFILQKYRNEMQFQMHKEIVHPSDLFINESKFGAIVYTKVIQMMYGDRYKNVIQDLRIMRLQLSCIEKKSVSAEDFQKRWICASNVLYKRGLNEEDVKFPIDFKTWEQSSAE